jgi:pimeloyl-ACP methyl ester carboxylesterase
MASSQLHPSISATQFYDWNGYRCAYDVQFSGDRPSSPPLLLIHPIGVGLSRWFWHPFAQTWAEQQHSHTLYNPDLLGCGESDKPRAAYYPDDWAQQLLHFVKTVIQQPVVLVSQGALFPVALQMVEQSKGEPWIAGMVLSGPPGWSLITQQVNPRSKNLLWNLFFDSPVGNGFYRYARRRAFLESFSKRQLFAREHTAEHPVEGEWLDKLQDDAQTLATRYAVFSFLAGFWRIDYTEMIESVEQPTLVLFGDEASGIDKVSKSESSQQRLDDYLHHLPNAQGKLIPGRNVLPYESTTVFVDETAQWLSSVFSS